MDEAQSKATSTLTTIERVVPIMIGTIGAGFGPQIYEEVGKATGWGFYSPATFFVGSVIAGAIGFLAGYVASKGISLLKSP